MTDLLDHLASLDVDTTVQHLLMPSMGLACGADTLTTLRTGQELGHRTVTLDPAETTCPACLNAHGDLDGLRAEMRRQMGHQEATA